MSVADLLWLLQPFAAIALAVAVGLRARPELGLILGLALVFLALLLLGYSLSNYPNTACQTGEPCPTGDRVIRVINPVFLWGGATLILVALSRTLWTSSTLLRPRHNRRRAHRRASNPAP
jgi:hypothetical protein